MRWLGVVELAACIPVGADRAYTGTRYRLCCVFYATPTDDGRLPLAPPVNPPLPRSVRAVSRLFTTVALLCCMTLHASLTLLSYLLICNTNTPHTDSTVDLCSGDAKLSTSGDVTVRQSVLFTTGCALQFHEHVDTCCIV